MQSMQNEHHPRVEKRYESQNRPERQPLPPGISTFFFLSVGLILLTFLVAAMIWGFDGPNFDIVSGLNQ